MVVQRSKRTRRNYKESKYNKSRGYTRRGTYSRIPNNYVLSLWGRLIPIGRCKAYCTFHKCYLQPKDIKEKKCNVKHCIYLRNLGKHKDIEERIL